VQLTERELFEISDRLMDHAALIEKFSFCANQCQSPQLSQMLHRQKGMLENHYSSLRNLLQQAQNNTGTEIQQQSQYAGTSTFQSGYQY